MRDAGKKRKQLLKEIASVHPRFGEEENVVTPILYIALDGTLLLINKIGAGNLGGVPDDFIGKKITEIAPDMAQTALERMAKAAESGTGGIFEDLVELPLGKRWFLTNADVVKNKAGEPIAFEVTCLDITEWKVPRQKVGLLSKVVEQSSEGIAVTNMDGYLLFVNEAFAVMHGYKHRELLGKHLSIFHSPEQMPAVRAANRQLRETGRFNGEIRHARRDGSVFLALMHNTLLLDKAGNRIGVVGTLRDITDYKRASEELEKSEQNYRSIFNAANDAIFVHDMETGRILDANEKTCEIFGYTREELRNTDVGALSSGEPPYTQKDASKWIKRAAEEGVQIFECRSRNKQGNLFWAEVSLKKAVIGTEGRVLAIVRDITGRKKTETALKDREQKYKTLVENVPGMVYRAYPDWSAEIFSGSEELCGYTSAELNSRQEHWLGLIHPDDKKKVMQEGSELVGEPKSIVQVYRVMTKAGQTRWVEDHKTSLFSDEGQFAGIEGIVFDITERKKAALALENRQKFEQLITSISRQFINLSSEQIDEGINQALGALGEFAEVDRSYIFQFFDDGRKMSNTHEWCAKGITPQMDNLQGLSVDSTPWWTDKLKKFENIYIPDVDKLPASAKNEKEILQAQSIQSLIVMPMVYNHQLVGFVGFDSVRTKRSWSQESIAMLTIVSEIFSNTLMRRHIQQELDLHYEKMRRAEQLASLGTVSATVAHELNQPLTVLRLFLQQGKRHLEDDNDTDKVIRIIDDCLSELTKAAGIVDRFRRFARKSAPVYIARVNLVEIANGIVDILKESARQKKLELSVTVESCPAYIIGNSAELEQMFFVLIQNAIQAADGQTGRELAITISRQDDQVHLTFTDTCGGIEQQNLDRIFEPFFTTKPANLGTGLGLCILERIVKRHGGSVRVESQPGQGTIFYIALPIGK